MQEQIRNLLMQALASQQQGNLPGAEAKCLEVLKLAPDQPDALQFLGLIKEATGHIEEAQKLMEQSLAVNPNQPHVLNNLANLYHDKGESDKGLELLQKAVAMQPAYWDAWYNLGKILFDQQKFAEAEAPLLKSAENAPGPVPRALTLLGNLYREKNDYDRSNAHFLKALQVDPNYFNALHNYGVSLKMQQRFTEALEVLEKAKGIKGDVPHLYYNIGNVHYEMGDIETAIQNYKKALELKPDFLEAHFSLNEVLWRAGRKSDYVASYRDAVKKTPKSIPLRIQYLDTLFKGLRFKEAEEVLAETLAMDPDHAELWSTKAKLLNRIGDGPGTIKAYEKAIQLDPNKVYYRKELSKVLIKIGKPQEALNQMEQARELEPFNQEVLAYLTLCWRLTGNEKAAWMNDFDAFIKAYTIPTPPGYESLAEFNQALNRALDKFHTDAEQPSDQTLRGGTQSIAAILDKNVKEIQEARASFEKTIARYVNELPDDPNHPLLSRKSKDFTFSGSWSVRLKDEGFHVNHTHPDGWLSSCYYVSIPPEVKGSDKKEGWIKFGESPLALGSSELIGKIVEPQEGLLVLFPSYMFHGTVPFRSDHTRTTLPFDVVPL